MAGKAKRNSEKEHRRKLKKARKETNRARYAALRDQGINSKSKRSILRSRRMRTHNKHLHEIAMCGNIGCKKCFPRPDKPHVVARKKREEFWKKEEVAKLRKEIRGKLGTLKELQQTAQAFSPFPLVRP